jgi:hypothetical protein
MTTSLFVGCSFTAGKGFELEKQEPKLWVNMLHAQNAQLNKTELVNEGESGASNDKIFYNAVNGLLKHRPEYAFVQWTGAPRYTVLLGLETYATTQYFGHDGQTYDHNLHGDITYTASYLEGIKDRFLSLHHPHADIVNVIKYGNTLNNLAKETNTRIFFINGLCPWDNEFFTKLENVLPDRYTKYTQEILETETRDDEEIFTLYNKIHNEYSQAGVDELNWLNLYNSFGSNKIDTNDDKTHPGINSNQLYFDIVNQSLIQKI